MLSASVVVVWHPSNNKAMCGNATDATFTHEYKSIFNFTQVFTNDLIKKSIPTDSKKILLITVILISLNENVYTNNIYIYSALSGK